MVYKVPKLIVYTLSLLVNLKQSSCASLYTQEEVGFICFWDRDIVISLVIKVKSNSEETVINKAFTESENKNQTFQFTQTK